MKHFVCSVFLACIGTLFAELPTPIAHWTFAPAPEGDDTPQGKFVFSDGKL